MMSNRIRLSGIALSLVVAILSLGACASTKEEPSRTQVRGAFVADASELEREVADEEVMLFAAAYVEVIAIQQRYHQSIQAAQEEERPGLVEKSEAEIEEAITRQGLTSEQFNAIAVRIPLDEELRARVQVEIQEQEEARLQELREAEGL